MMLASLRQAGVPFAENEHAASKNSDRDSVVDAKVVFSIGTLPVGRLFLKYTSQRFY